MQLVSKVKRRQCGVTYERSPGSRCGKGRQIPVRLIEHCELRTLRLSPCLTSESMDCHRVYSRCKISGLLFVWVWVFVLVCVGFVFITILVCLFLFCFVCFFVFFIMILVFRFFRFVFFSFYHDRLLAFRFVCLVSFYHDICSFVLFVCFLSWYLFFVLFVCFLSRYLFFVLFVVVFITILVLRCNWVF